MPAGRGIVDGGTQDIQLHRPADQPDPGLDPPKPPPPGKRQRFGDQTRLANPSLALDQHDPCPSRRGILNDGAHDVQLDRPADQPDPGLDSIHSHAATIVGTRTGHRQQTWKLRSGASVRCW